MPDSNIREDYQRYTCTVRREKILYSAPAKKKYPVSGVRATMRFFSGCRGMRTRGFRTTHRGSEAHTNLKGSGYPIGFADAKHTKKHIPSIYRIKEKQHKNIHSIQRTDTQAGTYFFEGSMSFFFIYIYLYICNNGMKDIHDTYYCLLTLLFTTLLFVHDTYQYMREGNQTRWS